jgi:DNA-binding beta-propeller fold protein YncE
MKPSQRRIVGWGIGIGASLTVAVGLLLVVLPSAASSVAFSSAGFPGVPIAGANQLPNSSCAVGNMPDVMAFNPTNNYVYVPNRYSANLSVLQGCTVVATISFPSGSYPVQAAYNPENQFVYVTDQTLNQVYIVNGTTLLEAVWSPLFDGPFGLIYDPLDHMMAVSNQNSGADTIVFMNGTTIAFSTTVGSQPGFFAYDPHYQRLLVPNYGSNNVTSMSAKNPAAMSSRISIGVGSEPHGIAYDPLNQRDYVPNLGGTNVTVISAVGAQYGSISVGYSPREDVWDPNVDRMIVSIFSPGELVWIEGNNITRTIVGPTGVEFSAVGYDASSTLIYTTGWNDATVYTYK